MRRAEGCDLQPPPTTITLGAIVNECLLYTGKKKGRERMQAEEEKWYEEVEGKSQYDVEEKSRKLECRKG